MVQSPIVRSLFCACVLLTGSSAFAQDGTRSPVPHNQVLSANPFGLMFEWFNADYERKINESSTWGLSGSFFSLGGDADYVNAQATYRYYPQGAALSGFYLGGKGGLHSVGVDEASGRFFGLGFELGYNWLLGERRNVLISTGLGAKRIYVQGVNTVSAAYPTARFTLGLAF